MFWRLLNRLAVMGLVSCGLCLGEASAQTKPSPAPQPAAPAAAAPPPAPITGPQTTTATYADWVLRCQQASEKRLCEIAQTLQVSGQQAPVALVAFGRDNDAKAFKIVIQLPLNIWIDTGVKLALKDVPAPIEARFRNCVPAGCFAEALVKDEVVAAMKAATAAGTIKFKDALQRDVTLPFSLRGFGPALDALPKA